MLGKKCSLTPLKEELRKQGVSRLMFLSLDSKERKNMSKTSTEVINLFSLMLD